MKKDNSHKCVPDISHGARVRYSGIVIAISKDKETSTIKNVVVCSAALGGYSPRQKASARRKITPIWINVDFSMQPDEVSCGDIIEGVGAIKYICDQYIMVAPVEDLKITSYGNARHENAFNRLTGSQRFAIRSFATECINLQRLEKHCNEQIEKYYEIIEDMIYFQFFSCLFPEKCGTTLAYIEAEGMLLSEAKLHERDKWQIWILASAFPRYKYLPILIICNAKGGHGHAYGSVFSLKIPLISITPYWTHTIFRNYPGGFIGGVARATHIPMSDTIRIALFHAVSNMLCAPEEIKTMIFGSWLESLRPSSLLVKWGEEVDDIEKLYGCAHAWWGEFYWDLRFKIHKTEKLPIKVIYTSYPDGQMDRIMIVADGNGDTLDIANERTCAVTLQNDPPEFFDGKYRPTATEWRYICKWIELNRDLLCDIEFFDDYKSIRDVEGQP